MYENGKMRPVEAILKMGVGGIKKNDGGANLMKMFYKHLCKYYNVPPVQQ
jgi:hypothetical protein